MLAKFDFPNGSRALSHVELTPEQVKAIQELLEAGMELHRRQEAALKLLPENAAGIQFFGNYDVVIIDEKSKRKEEVDA
jgi:cellulose biosynthesis protein BcsQ